MFHPDELRDAHGMWTARGLLEHGIRIRSSGRVERQPAQAIHYNGTNIGHVRSLGNGSFKAYVNRGNTPAHHHSPLPGEHASIAAAAAHVAANHPAVARPKQHAEGGVANKIRPTDYQAQIRAMRAAPKASARMSNEHVAQAANRYSDYAYADLVNTALRGEPTPRHNLNGEAVTQAEWKQAAKDGLVLQKAAASSNSGHSVLWRGMVTHQPNFKAGSIVTHDALVSTSHDRQLGEKYTDLGNAGYGPGEATPVLFKYKGTPSGIAGYNNNSDAGELPPGAETILPKGQAWRVQSVTNVSLGLLDPQPGLLVNLEPVAKAPKGKALPDEATMTRRIDQLGRGARVKYGNAEVKRIKRVGDYKNELTVNGRRLGHNDPKLAAQEAMRAHAAGEQPARTGMRDQIMTGTRKGATFNVAGLNITRSRNKDGYIASSPDGKQYKHLTQPQMERFAAFLDSIQADPKQLPSPTPGATAPGGVARYLQDLQRSDLSPRERQSVMAYSQGIRVLNDLLRNPGTYVTGNYTPQAINKAQTLNETLQGVIDRSQRTSRTLTLYRGVAGPYADRLKQGAVIAEPGFMSTSSHTEAPAVFAYDIPGQEGGKIMHIKAPPGTKGLWMPGLGREEFDMQNEFVLGRGTAIQIDKVEGDDVYATIVAQA